jgi:hypothetical protein
MDVLAFCGRGRWPGYGRIIIEIAVAIAATTALAQPASGPAGARRRRAQPAGDVLINAKDDGYRGIWYMNQPSGDEYVYKYSGGNGTCGSKHVPLAIYVPEVRKTFFVYGGTTSDSYRHLLHMVSYYDHATGMVPRPTILLDKRTGDAHDNPVISVDDKGYIWVFSPSHGRVRPSYISKSKRPYSIDEFELVWTGNFSYPQPWFVPGQGFLFMQTFYNPGRNICMMTSPDGREWSGRRLLARIDEGHYQTTALLPGGRIGSAFNFHPKGQGLNWRTNLYYMESADFGRTWKTVDGRELKIPLTEIHNPALIHDYQADHLLVYMKDVTCDERGRPIIVYITSKGYESGPKNDPRAWTTAHWTGEKWDINSGGIISHHNYDMGSLYVEPDGAWRLIAPTQDGPQRYNPGGEVAVWLSRDQGKTWKMIRQITAGSTGNHTHMRRPVNAQPDFYALWADGNARQPSASRLYFCNREGDVFRLPVEMTGDFARPERVPAPDRPEPSSPAIAN